MRVQPYAYIKQAEDGGLQFPTLTSTLVDYWRSDQGITLSGANVIEWEGQANATVLEDVGTGPTVSGSNADFNNVDTLTFDGSSQGLGKIFNNLGGTGTGDVYMCLYGAPHAEITRWGATFGFSGLQGTADFPEAIMRSQNSTTISVWINPDIASTDDTYGKGIYTVSVGDNDPVGMAFYNKDTVNTSAGANFIGGYKTARQGFTIGTYNIDLGGQLNGRVDVAGLAIFVNPPDAAARLNDMAAIEAYFSTIYG